MTSIQVIGNDFEHIIRMNNTNLEGKQKVWHALTAIRGVGRRFACLACRKAEVDPSKRAGELKTDEIEKLQMIITQPEGYKIPTWMFNRKKDHKDGTTKHTTAQQLDVVLRDDLERLKKIRCNRGLRHYWGLKVRGQRTKSNGRAVTVGVIRKR
ncbi:MAG: uncharacterized protein KVP18_003791 [Porospora cf. gigantea A]|uniref:uncharacterized protein n=1 Tax=Porospora cf. gigantea A TaxID=2853593 RepID=UPI0035594F37|nr:MAG: hypothetical protein KVP18_003791 [Porospora cf. gigantea A]